MTRAILAVALAAALVGAAGPAAALSGGAEAIVARVKQTTDINQVCKSRGTLRSAVQAATEALVGDGTVTSNARATGQEAGKYILDNCGQL